MDDGGGILSAWGAIHMIGTLGIRVARTLRAVLWVNEENGDRGGQAYATEHAAELNATSIALESDEGAFSPYTLAFTGHDAAYNQLVILSSLVASLGAGNVTRGGGGTDIGPMCELGVPCSSMPPLDPRSTNYSNNPCRDMMSSVDFENKGLGVAGGIPPGYFWFHHTASDTVDRLDPAQLQLYSVVMAIWTMSIADLPELLPRSGPVPPAPSTPAPQTSSPQSPPPLASSSGFMTSASTVATSIGIGVVLAAVIFAVVMQFSQKRRRSAQGIASVLLAAE
jgi:carboxypeptidase Q